MIRYFRFVQTRIALVIWFSHKVSKTLLHVIFKIFITKNGSIVLVWWEITTRVYTIEEKIVNKSWLQNEKKCILFMCYKRDGLGLEIYWLKWRERSLCIMTFDKDLSSYLLTSHLLTALYWIRFTAKCLDSIQYSFRTHVSQVPKFNWNHNKSMLRKASTVFWTIVYPLPLKMGKWEVLGWITIENHVFDCRFYMTWNIGVNVKAMHTK